MKHFIVILGLILATNVGRAQTTVWKVDKSHSSVGFSIDHMVVSEVVGEFGDFSVNIKSDKPDFTDAAFDATIQVKSINTKEPKRDDHLRGEDFFDEAKYPVIKFVGKKFEQVSGKQYKVTGDLTMHGVTKTVTLEAKFNGTIKDSWGNTRAGIKVSGEVDRYDFGLKYNAMLEAGGLTIGQTVHLNINLELIKSK